MATEENRPDLPANQIDQPNAGLEPDRALGNVRRFFRANKEVLFLIVGLTATPLIVNYVFAAGPPWPSVTAIGFFTSITIWVITIFTYISNKENTKKSIQNKLRFWCKASLISMILYCTVYAFTVYSVKNHYKEVSGFILRPEIQKMLTDNPAETLDDAIEGYEFNPLKIWTDWSVKTNRLLLLLSWLLIYLSISRVSCLLVCHEYKAIK